MDNQVSSMPLGPYDPVTHQEVCVWGVDVYENQRGMDGHENDLRGRRIKRGLFRYVLWEAFAPYQIKGVALIVLLC